MHGGATFAPGKVSQAFSFDGGSNSYVFAPNANGIAGGPQATYDAWIYPTAVPPAGNYGGVFGAGDSTLPLWQTQQCRLLYSRQNSGDPKFYMDCGTDNAGTFIYRYTANSYPPNNWYFVAAVVNNGNIDLYVNGVLDDGVGTSSPGSVINTNAYKYVWMGAQVRSDQSLISSPFTGLVDEVEISNRALSQSEIQTIFSAGGAGKCKTSTNRPPVALCRDMRVAAGQDCAADASVDDGSFDPDQGDTLTLSQSPQGPYPLGNTAVTLTATDNHGATSSCNATVTVIDRTPPSITNLSVTPSNLWPPNHKMVDVVVAYDLSDDCGPVTGTLSVTSNEGTPADWQILDAHHVRLRAERLGGSAGRIYTITVIATDALGNPFSRVASVLVPHDQGR